MTDSVPSETESAAITYSVELQPAEVALLRTSLRLLLATLGREEADEVKDVKALLAHLPDVGSGDRSG
ncbi:MAG TPA: hypothetical protein VGQ89_15860 [Candidatus Limnocylindrales bacterium]|jgi:hypothetical protein|nr:hypothetical protein [Candidatus Limnocylindrales bacterium]